MEDNNENKKTILIVDDEKPIVEILVYNLQKEGYNTLEANDGISAVDIALSKKPDLILLDIMLPKLDGLAVCKKIRHVLNVPILMLTAKDEEIDKILGLELGADDYVTKPFNPIELIARVNALIRRYTKFGAFEESSNKKLIISGGLIIDDELKKVIVDGIEVKLTPTEYNILKFLTENKGKVFSIEEIYTNVWNGECYAAENVIAVHIRHIREKIEINPKEPKYLKVLWGVGYKVEG